MSSTTRGRYLLKDPPSSRRVCESLLLILKKTPLYMQELIEGLLARVGRGEGAAMVRSCWGVHRGEACRGVRWPKEEAIAGFVESGGIRSQAHIAPAADTAASTAAPAAPAAEEEEEAQEEKELKPFEQDEQLETLETLAIAHSGATLAAIFRMLARDYNKWAGGMPDLTLWNGAGTTIT